MNQWELARSLEFTDVRMFEVIIEALTKAIKPNNFLNAFDTALFNTAADNPDIVPPLIVKMRKRGMLQPVDLTELRLAYTRYGAHSDFRMKFFKAVSETQVEREARKETPKNETFISTQCCGLMPFE